MNGIVHIKSAEGRRKSRFPGWDFIARLKAAIDNHEIMEKENDGAMREHPPSGRDLVRRSDMKDSKSPPIERKYAMTRVKAGDYILPDNDGDTIWRLHKYEEDETVTWEDGRPVKGSWWRVLKWIPTKDGVLDPEDWDRFDEYGHGFRKREEAIQYALAYKSRLQVPPPPKDLNLPEGVGIGYVLSQQGTDE